MPAQRALLVGLASDAVDFDKWPNLTKERLEQAFTTVHAGLTDAGIEPTWCLIDAGPESLKELQDAIRKARPHVVSIGAGVRADPEHLRLFESLVNAAHAAAPDARFAFNTDPIDTIESVKRAVAAR